MRSTTKWPIELLQYKSATQQKFNQGRDDDNKKKEKSNWEIIKQIA